MNYQKVPAKLAELCQLINQRRKTLLQSTDVIEQYLLSFDAHYQLVTIHPWVDGNGRMSRLVMNHLQYEFGLVPVNIVKEDKAEYIQALVDSREQESLEPFHEFMMEEHARNIAKEIEAFKKSQNDDPIKLQLFQAIVQDGALNYAEYAAQIGVSEATVKRRLGELKNDGVIIRVGSKKTGRWEILDSSGR